MRNTEPRYYFALPRLIARAWGGNSSPAETNWVEANVAGGLVHGIAYLFAALLFLRDLSPVQQALLFLPLAVFVWLAWLLVLYINSLVIRLLRAGGMLRKTPDDRAQGLFIGVMTTAFAVALLRAGAYYGFAGGIWLAALSVNFLAAALLALLPRNGTTAA